MDKSQKQELFSAILASGILDSFIEKDASLAEMVKSAEHRDIHYYETYAVASELTSSLKQRLNMMAAKNIDHNLDATKKLVAFMDEYPHAQIGNVTFNAPTQHYGVRCGIADGHLHVICVMTGGHISDALLGDTIK
jgi:hypothetical protein